MPRAGWSGSPPALTVPALAPGGKPRHEAGWHHRLQRVHPPFTQTCRKASATQKLALSVGGRRGKRGEGRRERPPALMQSWYQLVRSSELRRTSRPYSSSSLAQQAQQAGQEAQQAQQAEAGRAGAEPKRRGWMRRQENGASQPCTSGAAGRAGAAGVAGSCLHSPEEAARACHATTAHPPPPPPTLRCSRASPACDGGVQRLHGPQLTQLVSESNQLHNLVGGRDRVRCSQGWPGRGAGPGGWPAQAQSGPGPGRHMQARAAQLSTRL